ncbi:hypothetical protein [Actinoplanes sp. CA-252034]|uniref:hypothetical protein n=1 Tax=Actinoplanes sp. CA-252034 TaxID=3239906 RepID=UPI003D9621C3
MTDLTVPVLEFWAVYAGPLLLAAGVAGVVALALLGVWAKRSKKPLRPVALAVSMNLALLLNAEGMWVIATDEKGLNLPPLFAVLVFAVFEICFLTATSLAAEQYRRTTVYGDDGAIVTPGSPGRMLWIAALIAALSGVIVASNAATRTETLLRLAVPCIIFLMWWAALTAAGQKVNRSRFAYSPRRLAERWGWLIPDDDPDLVAMAAARQARRMVVNYYRVSAGRWPRIWWRSRLLRDARTAGEDVVADVLAQLARTRSVMDLLIPAAASDTAPALPAADSAPALPPAPVPATAVRKTPAKRVTPRPASAEKVAKAAARMPGATVAQIAAKAGVSERTARRYLPDSAATVAAPSAPVPAQTPTLAAA